MSGVGAGASAAPAVAPSGTPTIRESARRWRFWLAILGVAVVGLIIISLVSGGGRATGKPFSITSASPDGSKATAEVLRGQGVDVVQADTLDEARAALSGDADATLFFTDPGSYLTDDRLDEAAALSDTVVLLMPGSDELAAFAPGIAPAGKPQNTDGADAFCAFPAAERAGRIIGDGRAYRDVDGDATAACFPSGDTAFSLLRTNAAGRSVTVLGTADVLRNDGITGAGNAALALGLLGENNTLVWYLPTAADVEANGPADLASLTPDWVTPVLLLVLATFVAATVWRGRRLGALVIENLPVTVRSRETMEGRARLYARSGAHGHALDALRIGTITRLTSLLALPRNAAVPEVIVATAAVLPAWPTDDIRNVLVAARPNTERDLIELSDRLLVLERAVTTAVRP